jgi:hypothetical protein
VASFTPGPLYLREKIPRHQTNCNLGGPRSQFVGFGLKKHFLPLQRIKPLFFRCPPSSPGTMFSMIFQLASQINTFPIFSISISFYKLLLSKNRVPCTRSMDLKFEKMEEIDIYFVIQHIFFLNFWPTETLYICFRHFNSLIFLRGFGSIFQTLRYERPIQIQFVLTVYKTFLRTMRR